MRLIFKLLLKFIPRPILIRISYFIRPIITFCYKGNNYTDPIDGRSFRKFLPYGYDKLRYNVLSPSTYSLERHRLLWLFLKTKTIFETKAKMLHFAPEPAFYDKFINMKNIEYTTTDLNSPLAMIKADICKLPFASNYFDIILCNHVLEHIENDKKAISELYRVLKPGGMGVFQVPLDMNRISTFEDNSITDPRHRAKIFGQYDHVRIYGLDYFKRLESCGFKVEKVDFTKTLSKEEIAKYCINEGEIIPVVYKPN